MLRCNISFRLAAEKSRMLKSESDVRRNISPTIDDAASREITRLGLTLQKGVAKGPLP
jgi:hypothetical protein